jgi:hypothetical protein
MKLGSSGIFDDNNGVKGGFLNFLNNYHLKFEVLTVVKIRMWSARMQCHVTCR